MFEQSFKNLDNVLRTDDGMSSELDYIEQSTWLLFLKYLDDLDGERAIEADLTDNDHEYIFTTEFRWSSWAAPKTSNGGFDYETVRKGEDLVNFVNNELFPYLKGFQQRASSPDTIEYKIGQIFNSMRFKFQDGYSLRDAIEIIDTLNFGSAKEQNELSDSYEARVARMGIEGGRKGGEYYTPRPLIRSIIQR